MRGQALDRRDRLGAFVGLGTALALMLVLGIGVTESVGDRLVLPLVLAGVLATIGLSRRRVRLLAATVASGVAAGAALGVALRLAMRLAAVMEGPTELTVEGTAVIMFTSLVFGTALALVCALLRRLVPVRADVTAAVAAVVGTALLRLSTGDELAERGVLGANLAAFAACFALYGWLVVTVQERVERWWDRRKSAA